MTAGTYKARSTDEYQIFDETLADLEAAFQTRHIATFEVVRCHADEDAGGVFASYPDFDQFPVEEGNRIVGVLERSSEVSHCVGPTSEWMTPLHGSMLVAGSAPISSLLSQLNQPPYYRLVLQNGPTLGLVTRSDLLKLPVRLLAFSLVTHLELTMMEVIRAEFPKDEDWLCKLSLDFAV